MRILFAGSGAMGSRFGALLYNQGHDIVFADTWDDHIDTINEYGLNVIIDGKDLGYYSIPAMRPEAITGRFDVIFIFTKAMNLTTMLDAIKHIITPTTHVICLLNGLGHREILERYCNPEYLHLGVTVWTSALQGPGIVDAVGTGSIELQTRSGENSDRDQALCDVLNEAGLNITLREDVDVSIWNKVALNAVLNPLCSLIDCNIASFGAYPENDALINAVIEEVVAVGRAEGIDLDHDHLVAKIENVVAQGHAGDHYPSLYQDLANERRTEIDFINGAIVSLGQKHAIPTPVCSLLTHMIHAKENTFQ